MRSSRTSNEKLDVGGERGTDEGDGIGGVCRGVS